MSLPAGHPGAGMPAYKFSGPILKQSEWMKEWREREAEIKPPPMQGGGAATFRWKGGKTDGTIELDETVDVHLRGPVMVLRNGRQKREVSFKLAPNGPKLKEWEQAIRACADKRSPAAAGEEEQERQVVVRGGRPSLVVAPATVAPRAPREEEESPSLQRNVHATGKYEGEYEGEARHGAGTMKYSHGDAYTGQWRNDKKDGKGTYRFGEGDVYEGEWRCGVQQGRGEYRASDGDSYDGEWRNGCKEGKGIYRASDGGVFDGRFSQDSREGGGSYVYADGIAEVSMFLANCAVDEGARWSSDRQTAWRLHNGEKAGEISLDEAFKTAVRLDRVVPPAGPPTQARMAPGETVARQAA